MDTNTDILSCFSYPLFVESMQNYLKLHFKDKSFVIHQTMSSLEKNYPCLSIEKMSYSIM
ncbi:LytTR family transcriptional regulator [Bacteroides sp. 51]|uniref:LytTR family transcriptional regulator n=1 Tax=Bacteroides sp. 51 TaxID=2302938 RepID=UPI00194027D2|nr:LytTR family transcriptional regulator [Bacteroides sp. 51]